MQRKLTLSKFEALDGALSAYGYASRAIQGGDLSVAAVEAEISAMNRLYSAVRDDVGGEWADEMTEAQMAEHAAVRVASYLVAA